MSYDYNREHWERLMQTIIERVGVDSFLDHAAYALSESGYHSLARRLEDLRYLQVLAEEAADD